MLYKLVTFFGFVGACSGSFCAYLGPPQVIMRKVR